MAVRCYNCKGTHPTAALSRACHQQPQRAEGASVDPEPLDVEIRDVGIAQIKPFDPVEKEVQRLGRLANPTLPEAALWEHLRDRRLDGFAFHREFKIRGWVVDFYCPAGRLVVEVDGRIHETTCLKDTRRDEILRANWYKVRRLEASTVLSDIDAAVALIGADLDNPTALKRKTRYGLPGESRTYVISREPETMTIARSAPPKKRLSVANPPKRSFLCQTCNHAFVAAVRPQPRCYTCEASGDLVMVCFKCSKPLLPDSLDSGMCGACRNNDAHLVAVEAAGPGAHGPDGFQLKQADKGKMYRGR